MRLAARLALAGGVTLASLALVEGVLRAFPGLLPADYLERFPMHGAEFFRPHQFDDLPVEGIPLPLPVHEHRGVPPADLKERGVAPADDPTDATAYPDLWLPADELGLPNPALPERADLVLVGDSFVVSAGVERPPGLRARLARATGLVVYDAGVAGLGLVSEAWIVEHVALPLRPRCVLVFFFGGNDVVDSAAPLYYRRLGLETWREAYADRRPPPVWSWDLLRWALRRGRTRPAGEALPPVRLVGEGGSTGEQPGADAPALWLSPEQLRDLRWSEEQWLGNVAWQAVEAGLRRMRELCDAAGVELLLVYLPSKSQALLPYLARDPELLHRYASHGASEPPEETPEELYELMLANRSSLERLVLELCAREGVGALSATPVLEAQAAAGELGYLATDTHWQTEGQAALVEPLVRFLRAEGVLPAD